MSIASEFDRIREKRRAELNTTPSQTPGGPVRYFDSLLNNTYEFPAGTTPDAIRAAVAPIHERARASASLFSGVPQDFVRQEIGSAAKGVGSYMSDMAGAAGRALGVLSQTKVQPPAILQRLAPGAPQGPPSPTMAEAFLRAVADHQAKTQLPVTPATAQGPAVNLPANPYIDRNTAAMMQAPGIVPRAPVSPNDQNFAAMMPSQGAIPVQPMQGQGMGMPQNPYPGMDVGALNQIGTILQQMDPVPRFPKVDRATAAALGNNFQPYMQARRADIQSQQQDQRTKKENALREKAMFMQQQRAEQERRDRLAYQQMLMDNNDREEQLALKRFEMETARATRDEQRFQEEQRQNAMPQWKVDTNMGMAYALDPATGQVMVQPIPEMQAAMARRAAGSGGGGDGGGEGLTYSALQFAIRNGVRPDTVAAYENGTATPDQQTEIAAATYRMQVAEVQEKRQTAKDSVLRAGGSAEEAEAAAGQYQLPPEPPEVASRRRAEDFARNAGVYAAGQGASPARAALHAQAAESLLRATPEEMQKLLDAGLVTKQQVAAVTLSRKIPTGSAR